MVPGGRWPDAGLLGAGPDAPGGVGRGAGRPGRARRCSSRRVGPRADGRRRRARRAARRRRRPPWPQTGRRSGRPRAVVRTRDARASIVALLGVLRAGAVARAGQPVGHRPRARPRGARRPPGAGHLRTDGRGRPRSVPAAPRSSASSELALDRRAHAGSAPARARQPDDDALIVYTSGTTGQAEGGGAHPRLPPGRRLGAADGLGLGARATASSSACRSSTSTASVPDCSARSAAGASAVVLDRFDEPAVLGGCAGTGTMFFGVPTMYHRLAATGTGVEQLGLASGLCVSGSAPLAAALWHRSGRCRRGRARALRHDRDAAHPVEPPRRRAPCRLGRRAAPRRRGRGRRRRRDTAVGELLVRGAVGLPRLLGPATTDSSAGDWFATGDLVSVSRRRLRHGARPAHRADHHGRPQRLPRRGRGRAAPATPAWPRWRSSACPRPSGAKSSSPTSWAIPTWRRCTSWRSPSSPRSSAHARCAVSMHCPATHWARSCGASCAEVDGGVGGAPARPACGSVSAWPRSSCSPRWGPTGPRR